MKHLRSIPLLLIATSVAAQERPDSNRLAPVIITASRTESTQAVSTAATTVMWGDALRARGITTVGAALREVPGASVVQSGSQGSETALFLRGGERDYVQVLIDGVTVNEPGGFFNFANVTTDNIDRIEIVRGPTSVLYGSDAMAGVIQIFTRTASGQPRPELRARAGERGGADLEASVAAGSARFGYSLGAGHHLSSGVHELNNDYRNDVVSGRLRFAPISRGDVSLTGRFADARYNYPTEYSGDPLDSNSYNTERRLSVGLDAKYALNSLADARLVIGSSRFQGISDDESERPDDFGFRFEALSTRRNVDASVGVRLDPATTLTLGADFDWQRSEGTGEDPEANALLQRWSRAAYVQLAGDARSRLSYTLGARLEENERFGQFHSLRAAAGVALSPGMTARAAVGTAFKEPLFTELTGGGFARPNEGLDPERSSSWELAVEQRFPGDVAAVAVTYFDQAFVDLIEFVPLDSDPDFFSEYRNLASATSRGWELEGRAGIFGVASVRASVTVLDATVRATPGAPTTRLLRRPSRSASVVVMSPVSARLSLHGELSHVGRRDDIRYDYYDFTSARERLPSYDLIGVGGSYVVRRGTGGGMLVALDVRVDNLLDERYEAVAGFATPRRTLSIGARLGSGR